MTSTRLDFREHTTGVNCLTQQKRKSKRLTQRPMPKYIEEGVGDGDSDDDVNDDDGSDIAMANNDKVSETRLMAMECVAIRKYTMHLCEKLAVSRRESHGITSHPSKRFYVVLSKLPERDALSLVGVSQALCLPPLSGS